MSDIKILAEAGRPAPELPPTGIFVVIVTYGNRFRNLGRVVSAVLADVRVKKIIVVDNNADPESALCIQELEASSLGRIRLIRSQVNRGSAGGYKLGILAAIEDISCSHLWLLDDDNLPSPNCLSDLIAGWIKYATKFDGGRLCLASFRYSRELYRSIALNGQNARRILIGEENSCRGYHIGGILTYAFRKIVPTHHVARRKHAVKSGELIINLAPWGGMFFSRSLVEFAGLPDESLYLCMDDWEFSDRLVSRGGTIILIEGAGIVDLDEEIVDPQSSLTKFYYGTRNHIWFSRHILRTCALTYFFSRCLCIVVTWGKLSFRSSRERWRVFNLAVADAEAGAMGKKDYAFLSK